LATFELFLEKLISFFNLAKSKKKYHLVINVP
jgi:hypothetical protein